MESVTTAVICAAGTGTRLGVGVPKCLVSVGGRSIIDWQLDLLQNFRDLRIVVGFREQEVMRHVVRRRPDALFVRNPEFRSNTTLDSLRLATRHLEDPFIALDGDLIVEPRSFDSFLAACSGDTPVIGISRASTDDAVFVDVREHQVQAFHRTPAEDFEWSGPAFLKHEHLFGADGYVYESLIPLLPLRAHEVIAAEVDTQSDLERARSLVMRWTK